jgi:hypothetical protein
VARESTLDEFVGGAGSESDPAPADEAAATGTDATTETETDATTETETETDATAETETDAAAGPSVADATPATPTCGWRAGGAPCADCGASVEWLWTDGAGDGEGEGERRVCAACKDW